MLWPTVQHPSWARTHAGTGPPRKEVRPCMLGRQLLAAGPPGAGCCSFGREHHGVPGAHHLPGIPFRSRARGMQPAPRCPRHRGPAERASVVGVPCLAPGAALRGAAAARGSSRPRRCLRPAHSGMEPRVTHRAHSGRHSLREPVRRGSWEPPTHASRSLPVPVPNWPDRLPSELP